MLLLTVSEKLSVRDTYVWLQDAPGGLVRVVGHKLCQRQHGDQRQRHDRRHQCRYEPPARNT